MLYLELLFPDLTAPGDLEILSPATPEEPGHARLLAAKREPIGENASRVLSANGFKFFGFTANDEPLRPYNSTYWLENGNG